MSLSTRLNEEFTTPCLTTSRSRVMPSRSASRSGESPKASNSLVRAKAASESKVAVMMYIPWVLKTAI